MSENKEQVLQEIQAILKGKPLETFDVREYELSRILEENSETVGEDLDRYRTTENVLVKICIGKKWAPKNKLDFDYDTSLFSSRIYWKTIFSDEESCPISNNHGYEYKIESGGVCYRGDTMNSWSTTLREYFRSFGDRHLKHLEINQKRKNKDKWRIPEACPEALAKDLGAKWDKVDWEYFLSIPEVYTDNPVPSYITEFMRVVYTIGNFIPVPFTPNQKKDNFNTRRNSLCKDYWDLTLLAIYQYYKEKNVKNSGGWKDLLSRECVKHWLDRYGSWDAFVEGNFLQDFVNREGDYYGEPRPLWEGHFDGNVLPKNEQQFKAFFTNATEWITERSKKIAETLGTKVKRGSDVGEGI